MLDISKFDYSTKPLEGFTIDRTKLDYTKPKNPIDMIISSELNNTEKIEQIQRILIDNYKVVDGEFAYLLAVYTLGDKKIIKGYKKRIEKQRKKLKAKKKLAIL